MTVAPILGSERENLGDDEREESAFPSVSPLPPPALTSSSSSSMALPDGSRQSLIPNFLYSSSTKPLLQEKMLGAGSLSSSAVDREQAPSLAGQRSFMIPSPSEPVKKIEMFSPRYYAACAVGGSLCCGLTHTAITPLDLVKCNMQVVMIHGFRWVET